MNDDDYIVELGEEWDGEWLDIYDDLLAEIFADWIDELDEGGYV